MAPSTLFRREALEHHLRRPGGGTLLRLPWGLPAARRLIARLRSRRIPFVQQLSAAECGAACLAMVLGYHGRSVPLAEVRDVVGADRDGARATALLGAARHFGLRGRGVRVDVHQLSYLEPGAILHWEFNHFVVFDRLRPRAVDLVDPAFGRCRVPMAEFRRRFTGVALLLEPAEDFRLAAAAAGPLIPYLKRLLRQTLLWPPVLLVSFLLQGLVMATPLFTGALIDRVVPQQDTHLLWALSWGLAAMLAFHFLGSLTRARLLLRLRTHLDARMTVGFLEHLTSLPYAFLQRRSAGDLLMRLNSHGMIRETLTTGALGGILDGVLVGLYLILLWRMSPAMGLLALSLGALQVLLFLIFRRKQRELMTQELQAQARAQGYEVELLSGVETLKALGATQQAVERWTDLFMGVLNASLLRGKVQATADSLASTLRLGSPLVLLGLGAYQVMHGHLSLGTMLGLSALAGGFLGPLTGLVATAGQFQALHGYLERIADILSAAPEQEKRGARPAPRLRGQIALEQVSFRYGPLAPLAVQELSVRIEPGQFVAIAGASGSGKSTLASLLLGLYPPTSGRVLYDGLDLRELEVNSVRRQLGIVPQQPFLFGTTLRDNIAFADPTLPLDDIVAAARVAQLDRDIDAMPMKYETLLVDRGASLSGGQRQRLALARALVRRPALLLLDEATSALDAATELAVQEGLDALQCTRVVITHRLDTIARADLILVLDQGRLVEQGTHAQLIARGGIYAALVSAKRRGASHG
ncbi:peptidase domain-containing ABC transporter [Sorangium sp. So ce1389]|uniref:peptidase domain-containing ABC transporter n=1 Tax=Sorangium sp. So ce1389 TaxID=3133336 RepID=UPI003F5E6E39